MKIRIKGDFIRFRLTQPEVMRLAEGAQLAEETRFGPGATHTLVYALETKTGIDQLEASFADNKITLYLPEAAAKTWHYEERVGFENEQEVAPGIKLKMLLEKDFACLDETHEDQSDKYPNPNAACQPSNKPTLK